MKIRAYADLHLYFSRDDVVRYDKELTFLLDQLMMSNDLDLLVFAGDLVHKPYTIDDNLIPSIFQFIGDVIKICEMKKIQFRMIKGTSSHDGKIVEILESLYKGNPNVKFIPKAMMEEITFLNGEKYSFRWLPETYGTEEELSQFNKDIFSSIVDMTFFHGSVKSAVERWVKHSPVTTLPRSYIWEDELLVSRTRLFSAGGHIHQALDIPGNIFYINSYTTHNFADKSDKGYMEFEVSGSNWSHKRIRNTMAPNYVTFEIKDIHLMDEITFTDFLVEKLLQVDQNDRLRFVLYGDLGVQTNKNITILKDMTVSHSIKIEPKLNRVDVESTNNVEYASEDISIVDKIHSMYNEVHGVDLDRPRIEEYIRNEKER